MDAQPSPGPELTRKPKGTVIAVMPAWNVKSFLEKSVSSAREELRAEDDLIVVDNGSTDGSFEYLQERFPEVAILKLPTNTGGAGGFNAGIEEALKCDTCRFLWLLDSDTIIEPGALRPLLDTLSQDEQNAAAGSQICLYDQPDVIQEVGADVTRWFAQLKQHHRGEKRLSKESPPYPVGFLAACSLLVKAQTIREVGPFRADFFVFYDDVEWGMRVRKSGKRLMAVPASVIRHNFSATKPIQPWREYYRTRNRAVCLALHPPGVGRFFALWAQMGLVAARRYYTRWAGNELLFGAYDLAEKDLLEGVMGARDLSHLRAPPPEEIEIPQELRGQTVLIDMPERMGDALAVARMLVAHNSKTRCVVKPYPGYQKAGEGLSGVSFGDGGNCPVAVVGEIISSQAARASLVFHFCLTGFTSIHHPAKERIRYRFRKCLAGGMGGASGFFKALRFSRVVMALKSVCGQ